MSQQSKRILLIAYDFPPFLSIGGVRPYFWSQHLHDYNIEVIVVTRQWENKYGAVLDYIAPSQSANVITENQQSLTLLRAPYKQNLSNKLLTRFGDKRYKLVRKVFSFLNETTQYFLPTGTKRELYKAADDFLKNNKVDVILATGDPFVLFHYANKLSKKHAIPWIADYRDPWSHYYERENKLKYYLIQQIEKRIVRNASHITTVSDFIVRKVHSLVGPIPATIIPNGFDPQAIEKNQDIQQSKKIFTIAHAGSVYDWHPLERFLETIAVFKNQRPNFEFRIIFYGLNQIERLHSVFKKHPDLIPLIALEPRCPNDELIANLRSHHVMLLFNYYAYMGTKIFDYLGIRRNMLLCFENDPVANELKEKHYRIDDENANQKLQSETILRHNAGHVALDATDLVRILHDYANEFTNTQSLTCNSVDVERYSRIHQVKELATIIHTQF